MHDDIIAIISNSIAGSALHNAFLEAAKRLAKVRFPDVEKWAVARNARLATASYFYLDSERGFRDKTFVVFPASVCGDKDSQEWMDKYQQSSAKYKQVMVGEEPECTHCHTYIDSEKDRAVCHICGDYEEYDDEDEDPFAWCESCEESIQYESDVTVGITRNRHDVERHYFCCESCAEREGYYPVEDDDDLWHANDVTIDIDGNRWADADGNLQYSEYHGEYLPAVRAVWSKHLGSYIDEQNTIFNGFYGEDGDELVDDDIHEDEVVYSKLRECYILAEYAEKHPITQDWHHQDWDVKDVSKVVVPKGEVLPIEDTVYSRTLGVRIAKATAWYPDGEEYNPDYVLPAEFEYLRHIVFKRKPYVPSIRKRVLVHREIYEAVDYYLAYARSFYGRLKQIGERVPDEFVDGGISHYCMKFIRWNVGDIFGIFVNEIVLDSEGRAKSITYELRPSYND